MDWLDYREQLGIGFNHKDKVKYFMTKIFNLLEDLSDGMTVQISDSEYFTFCNMTGTPMVHSGLYGNQYQSIIEVLHKHSQSLRDFLTYYVAFISCQKDNDYKQFTRENFKNVVCNLLSESHIAYEVLEDNNGFFIFPKGVDEFDNALVSEPLRWLKQYPDAERAWCKALRNYADANEGNASDVADLFRKALETFFREFFGGNKSLENYKITYGDYLKSKGIPKEISGNFETILQFYTNFMNNYAKHRDATSDRLLEYLMYQTGNIIRLLVLLKL